jgi:hypothetical protein
MCAVAAAAWLVVLSAHSPAHASPSAAERETARNAMDEGDRLRSEGDLRRALGQFMAAHELMGLPTTGLEVARLQAQLGLLVEALQTALDAAHAPIQPDERPAIGQARRAAARLAEQLTPRVPSLTTRVVPSGVPHSITIDDVTLSETVRALPFKSNPGEHEIVVRAPGYQTVTQRIVLLEGGDRMVQVTLVPEPVAEVRAAAPAKAKAKAVTAKAEAPSDPAAAQRLRAIIALSVGGAALATGVVAGVASMAETGNAKAHCDDDGACPPAVWDDVETANTLANVANVSIPIGLIALGYGLYELFTLQSSEPTERPSARVALSIHPGGAGATWSGSL